ncbi:hypothetical protein V502_07820 [Pseudogymnoascus sp. VKM F-4520 (FW-2644)]|nr:hypothetical protein V502_07820 [Pseudogymnoascus sp. VKM F-4520 (FW-2644)]
MSTAQTSSKISNSAEATPCTDRSLLLPSHSGRNVFPNSPLFSRLLRHAHRNRTAVRDLKLGVEKTYEELLSNVLGLRQVLRDSLSLDTLEALEKGEEIYIGVLAGGGYEFTVGILVVLAIGAAAVPMSVVLPVQEAAYFVSKSKQVAILTASTATNLGQSIAQYVNKEHNMSVQSIEIMRNLPRDTISAAEMVISANLYLDDNAAGVVIFTSGTTGPPKGAVMRRAFVHDSAMAVAEHYGITYNDVILHVLPVHHATGIGITFFPFILAGACVEFKSGSFDPGWMWERWRQGGLTFFSGVPTIYMRMMRFYDQHLAKLPEQNRAQYVHRVNEIRAMLCGSSALPKPVQDFWTRIRNGKIILTRYGATEFGAVFKVPVDAKGIPDGSVGTAVPGVDVKLSEGNEGEILIKSPYMFSKYLFDDAATFAAHDPEGYFRTGDIGRRQGSHYWIIGRASLDIIKSGGYKISALDIEREVLGLPYISEVMVVGVTDEEFGQRVGAVVTLRDDQDIYSSEDNIEGKKLSLDELRKDLRGRLAGYKLPTLLRIMRGDLPKGQSGKVLKKKLGPELFPCPGWETHTEVQVWRNQKAAIMARL